ncbi:MAG: membrane protease subunit [bacterium]
MRVGPMSSLFSFIVVLGLIAAAMFIFPQWNVWRAELAGKAALAEAENARQVAIEEAKAQEMAAEHYARAEIARAKGVAEANRIVAEGLGGPEGYLRYLWIQKLGDNKQDVIYIPTEAGVPILEAGRLAE